MIKKTYAINENVLSLNNKDVAFPYQIAEVVSFEDVLIVRIDPPTGVIFNKNIFAVSLLGEKLWQISEILHEGQIDKPYVNIVKDGGGLIVSDWIGFSYFLNKKDGSVQTKSFARF